MSVDEERENLGCRCTKGTERINVMEASAWVGKNRMAAPSPRGR